MVRKIVDRAKEQSETLLDWHLLRAHCLSLGFGLVADIVHTFEECRFRYAFSEMSEFLRNPLFLNLVVLKH
jgi:hypothetical protein